MLGSIFLLDELTTQIFDLLDAVLPNSGTVPPTPSTSRPKVSNSFTRGSSTWAMSSMNLAALANGGGGVIRRQALALKNDPEGPGKYIAGLKEIRVRTREVSSGSISHELTR